LEPPLQLFATVAAIGVLYGLLQGFIFGETLLAAAMLAGAWGWLGRKAGGRAA
jgi:hypothetical protein